MSRQHIIYLYWLLIIVSSISKVELNIRLLGIVAHVITWRTRLTQSLMPILRHFISQCADIVLIPKVFVYMMV